MTHVRENGRAGAAKALRADLQAFDDVPAMVWVSDAEGRRSWFNRPWLEFTGRTTEQERGSGWCGNVHPEDRERCLATTAACFDKREPFEMEYRLRCKGGGYHWILDRGKPRNNHGCSGYIGTCVDITEEKRADAEIAAVSAWNQAILQNASDGIHILDAGGNVVDANDAFCRLLGYSRDEALSLNVADWDVHLTRGEMSERMAAGDTPSQVFETIYRRKDGSLVPVEINGCRLEIDGVRYGYGSCRDISERQQAEAALRESEARFRAVVDTIPAAIRIYAGQQLVFANNATSALSGYSREEVLAPGFLERIVHPDDRKALAEREGRRLRGESFNHHFDSRFVSRDGEVRWTANDVVPITFDGRPAILSTSVDITQRRRAEEALRESRALLQAIIEGTTDAVFVKNLDGRYLLANAATAGAFGREVAEILGRDDTAFFAEADAGIVMAADRETIESGRTRTYEYSLTAGDSQIRTFLVTKGPVSDVAGKVVGVFGVSRDITERKRLEAAFLQSEKLESLGELAGGLAHDFNNLLTVILGNSAMVAEMVPPDSEARQSLEEIENACARGAELARRLLTSSGREATVLRPVNLNALGEETVRLLAASFGARTVVQCEWAAELSTVQADAAQVQQVLTSIIVNAAEAVGVGGHIAVRTAVVEAGAAALDGSETAPTLEPGVYASFDVTDDGAGMSPETLSRAFDPFFTTKFAGRGLGLSAAQGSVRAHGGAITIRSAPGQGTTVRVLFPVGGSGSDERGPLA